MTVLALAFAGAVQAAEPSPEQRLTAAEIRDIARRELLWCDAYRAESGDCDGLTLMRLGTDGRLLETTTLLISETPRVQAFVADIDDFRGDSLCSTVVASRLAVDFTFEGRAVSPETSLGMRAVFLSSLDELEGKTICQTFFHSGDRNVLREEVTVDGDRRRDLETTYLLKDGAEGFGLRALTEDEDASANDI